MDYQLTLPQQLEKKKHITLIIPNDSSLPAVNGQWTRDSDDTVTAWYTHSQLRDAVLVGFAIEIGDVRARIVTGEQMIVQARLDGDEGESVKLEQHWVIMLEHLVQLLNAQGVVQACQ